ncbi:Emopamil binding protein [Pleurostoma richardsiae]|uniref:Emopamil binding protein n=1 Tax=Pleurostoma richardsiae TaxID=41990 RepID=A0AA38RW46_9PEZI|nr:Emopamil binding protein [Pleurostoma richardsiae]
MAQTFIFNHPYYPQEESIPGYVPNVTPVTVLLACFGTVLGVVLSVTVTVARRWNPSLTFSDQLYLCWFALCGFLHCFFEGYFIVNHETLPASQNLFAQLWKEYALSDSRYMTSDPFMLCVESITVLFWGPLCWAAAGCIATGNSLRYVLQVIVCLAHLYGVALYYSTCYAEYRYLGVSHSRPEFLYYWVYYVGFNLPWVVVPAIILLRSIQAIQGVFIALGKMERTLRIANISRHGKESKKSN